MSTKIEEKWGPLSNGTCVEVIENINTGLKEYGIILSNELVEMDENLYEYLYTVCTPTGVDDYWPYELRLVNYNHISYNNNTNN